MLVGNHYRNLCLWLILVELIVVDCSFVMDLVESLASNHVNCMVVIREHKSKSDFMIDPTRLSGFSLSLFDIKTSLPELSDAGKDCLYNMLIFDSVNSSLQFLNR